MFVPNGPNNNIAGLVQIMTWCLICDKALSEPMTVYFTDAYMRHSALMSYYYRMLPYKSPDIQMFG